jgi:outer membrane protein TolC
MLGFKSRGLLFSILIFSGIAAPLRGQGLPQSSGSTVVNVDLKGALERARTLSPLLQSAGLAVASAREDRIQAKTALFPTLNYQNQMIYTQGNGTPSGIFVANDGVHVYGSMAAVHQELYSPARMAEYRRSLAGEALSAARRELASRGVAATVIQDYYAVVAAQRRLRNARTSSGEARKFVETTLQLQQGGEVAHADTVKARLTYQQRERELQEAALAVEKAKVNLAVLIFSDLETEFTVIDDLGSLDDLPVLDVARKQAEQTSPELHAAELTIRQEEFGVALARTAYRPSLSIDYFFGINANEFAVHDSEGFNRLGSVAQASLNIPVWNWWAGRSKVRQAELKRQQAQLDLVLARKQLDSSLRTSYLEARAALAQLDSLRQSQELSDESLRLTTLRYQAGESSVLEVVDAQSTLAQARNAYDDGLSRYRLALANIQILTGTY